VGDLVPLCLCVQVTRVIAQSGCCAEDASKNQCKSSPSAAERIAGAPGGRWSQNWRRVARVARRARDLAGLGKRALEG
jgi:hypothetical protein